MLKIKKIIKKFVFNKITEKYILSIKNVFKETFINLIYNKIIEKYMLKIKNEVKKSFIDLISDKISNPKIILEIGSRDAIQGIEFFRIFPRAKIYAFECNPKCIKTCIENTKNNKNIEIIPCAVFNKNEKKDFYSIVSHNGAGSLFSINEDLSKDYPEYRNLQKEKITVDAIRIDTWANRRGIKKIDLVWIDVQGAEYEVFEGMGEYLRNVQAIYAEVENKILYNDQKLMKDVSRLLNENGFSLLKYTQVSELLWGNAIYINNNLYGK